MRELLELSIEADEMTSPTAEEEIQVTSTQSEKLTKTTIDILVQRRDMIAEYFSITVTPEGVLTTLPLLLKNYSPHFGKLPSFIRRLGRNVPRSQTKLTIGRLVHRETLLRDIP